MALVKLPVKTGLNRENTNYAGEGGYYNCDKIRFRSGYAEKIGGWVTNSLNTFAGICRTLFNWVSLSSEGLVAVGTNQRYYIQNNGTFYPITPIATTRTLALNPITTVNGSNVVTITDAAFSSTVGSFVNFTGATAVGGLTIAGSYEIVTAGAGTYQIYAPGATSNANGGGAAVVAAYELPAGSATYSALLTAGWGVSAWGSGAWGTGTGAAIPLSLWSQANWGEDLVFAARSGAIYYWVKNTVADAYGNYTPAITINAYAETKTKTTKAATFGAGVAIITVPDTINIDVGSIVTGTNIPPGTYVTTAWNGSTSVTISALTTGVSGGNYNFSYSGKTAPNQTNLIVIFSTYQFIVSLGSTPYDPTGFSPAFNPMLVRWSDQSVAAEWTPTTFNQSGEVLLANGSYIIGASVARQELLIWTDKALYSMQYVGAPFVFGFTTLMDNISIMSPNAMITVNNITYWMGVDKFYTYSGNVQPLPCTIRQYIFSNLNSTQSYQVVCGHNEEFSEVWWHYPSAGSNTNDSYVTWNYIDNNWAFGTMNRTAWYDTPLSPYPLAAISTQNSYLTAAITAVSATLNMITSSSFAPSGVVTIGSEQIAYTTNGGTYLTGLTRGYNSTVAAIHAQYAPVINRPANQLVLHENGIDDGSVSPPAALAAYIETSDFDLEDGEHFSFVSRIVPDITFDNSAPSTNPQILLTLNPRPYPGAAYTAAPNNPVNQLQAPPAAPAIYPVEQYTNVLYTRVRGRQISFRVESSRVGTTWQLGLMRFDIRPDGRR
jgi:hypothetical protein